MPPTMKSTTAQLLSFTETVGGGGGLQQGAASGVMLSPSSLLPQSNQKAQHILLQRWGKRSGSNMRRCPPRFDHSGGHRFRLPIRLSLSLFPFLSSMFSPWVRISVDMAVSGILTAANPASSRCGSHRRAHHLKRRQLLRGGVDAHRCGHDRRCPVVLRAVVCC